MIDPRNDENLILAQIHVLMAKFHNGVLTLLRRKPELSAGPATKSLPRQARRWVMWHYQWLILHDFLQRFIRAEALEGISRNRLRLFPRNYTPSDYSVALPVEFTGAAYRFGHSMIQSQYGLNLAIGGIPASELIAVTQHGGRIGPESPAVPASHVVDWDLYFEGPEASTEVTPPTTGPWVRICPRRAGVKKKRAMQSPRDLRGSFMGLGF